MKDPPEVKVKHSETAEPGYSNMGVGRSGSVVGAELSYARDKKQILTPGGIGGNIPLTHNEPELQINQ